MRIVLALAFAAASGAKLAGAPPMVQIFEQIGIGQWFRVVTALVELSGAILLVAPRTGFHGGLLLLVTMACAVLTHLLSIGGSPVPAAVLGALAGVVVYLLRPVR